MAQSEIQDLKRRANARDSRSRKRPKLNVDARCLTSEEGLRLSQEQEALKAAQEQKKREAQEQRAAKEAERQRQRMERDADEPFVGALTAKSKPDLQDVAQALGISIEGSKKVLLEHIGNHFGANPDLRSSPRYEGLFNRSRRRPTARNDENASDVGSGASGVPNPISTTSHGSAPFSFNFANFMAPGNMPQAGPSHIANHGITSEPHSHSRIFEPPNYYPRAYRPPSLGQEYTHPSFPAMFPRYTNPGPPS
jgi:hypothetical protein